MLRNYIVRLFVDTISGLLRKTEARKRQKELIELLKNFKNQPNNIHFGEIGMLNCPECISIGSGTTFGDWIYLTAWNQYDCMEGGKMIKQTFMPHLSIGENCNFGAFNHITCINEISIGDNLLTGKWVTITDNSHGTTEKDMLQISPIKRPLISKGPIKIGKNVWVGEKVTILPGVTIGDGVVIAANSVVSKDIPAYCVVAGNPAQIIKER